MWKREIKRAEINQTEPAVFLDEINFIKEKIEKQIKQIKNELLLGETIEFKNNDTISFFGRLKVKTTSDFVLSKEYGQLVKCFNQHSDLIRSSKFDEQSNKLITSSNDKTIN